MWNRNTEMELQEEYEEGGNDVEKRNGNQGGRGR